MEKKDLIDLDGISWDSVTKLSEGEPVSMEILMKIYKALDCNIGDIILISEEEASSGQQR